MFNKHTNVVNIFQVKKIFVFDMDGVLADLYGVEGWLNYLEEQNVTPYQIAKPLVDMLLLKQVRQAKKEWLDTYGFPYDEIHFLKYGTTKANATRKYKDYYQILIDDNKKIRDGWTLGMALDGAKRFLPILQNFQGNF